MADKVTSEDRGAVRILRINRPEQRNCVDGETAAGLARAIGAFGADPRARVLVVTCAGDLALCAGADLKNATSLFEHEFVDVAGPMGFARLDPGKPTIAAINGLPVVIFPDSGTRYLSKFYDDKWMREFGFLSMESGDMTLGDLLFAKPDKVLHTAALGDAVRKVAAMMRAHGISQAAGGRS